MGVGGEQMRAGEQWDRKARVRGKILKRQLEGRSCRAVYVRAGVLGFSPKVMHGRHWKAWSRK